MVIDTDTGTIGNEITANHNLVSAVGFTHHRGGVVCIGFTTRILVMSSRIRTADGCNTFTGHPLQDRIQIVQAVCYTPVCSPTVWCHDSTSVLSSLRADSVVCSVLPEFFVGTPAVIFCKSSDGVVSGATTCMVISFQKKLLRIYTIPSVTYLEPILSACIVSPSSLIFPFFRCRK